MTNDLHLSSDHGCISLLVLLDLSAVFNTIDHNIIFNCFKIIFNCFGISGSVLACFKSYLSYSHQFVAVNEEVSYRSQVQYGVPQGSVLGLLLFTLYMLPLGNIIRKHRVSFHCYADDTQLYISSRPGKTDQIEKLLKCIVTFTFMHLVDTFIQSDLQSIQAIHLFLSVCVFSGNWTHNLLHC